ncbi:MAG: DMT family transporter [Rhodospirillales bacterium]|nr:DMT family transporter [Rhodospirillales bacterium]
MSSESKLSAQNLWIAAMPGVFVLLWSTGFIGAKLGLPYAEPFTFLLIRYSILSVILVIASLALRAPWPASWGQVMRLALIGLLVHGTYLGGVFAAISFGLSAGVSALIVGMQPLLTALIAGPILGEKITTRQWLGLVLGFCGVALVVAQKVSFDTLGGYGVLASLVALLGITLGTLYQKKHGGEMDLRTGSAIQFMSSAAAMAIIAPLFETMEVQWTGEFIFALSWLVIVLSLGAISLLFILIRRGAAAQVASLFYLVPPVVALIAFFLFDEQLGLLAILGMAVAVVGVAMVIRAPN